MFSAFFQRILGQRELGAGHFWPPEKLGQLVFRLILPLVSHFPPISHLPPILTNPPPPIFPHFPPCPPIFPRPPGDSEASGLVYLLGGIRGAGANRAPAGDAPLHASVAYVASLLCVSQRAEPALAHEVVLPIRNTYARTPAQEIGLFRRARDRETNEFRATYQRKEQRREWDLQDPKSKSKEPPTRLGDVDPRLGPASMQVFSGEDLDGPLRKKVCRTCRSLWLPVL